jgi:hypothetical protein
MLAYCVTSGALTRDGDLIATGYSGHGEGLNNPALEADPGVGPIPAGTWRIGPPEPHPNLGPLAMPLTPLGHDAHGRSAFFIHGDNAEVDHSASHGCIILSRLTRMSISVGCPQEIEVTP